METGRLALNNEYAVLLFYDFIKEMPMLASKCVRPFIVLIMCLAMTVPSAQAGQQVISNGQVAAAAVGAGIVIAVGVYVAYKVIKKQKTIEGCVETAENPLMLTDLKDKKTYVLESESLPIKPGQHLKVKGKKSKDKSGMLHLRVKKIVKDFGSCTQVPVS